MLTATKQNQFLVFNNGEREIRWDLSDNKFKRVLKDGSLKEVADTGVAGFFRNIPCEEVPNAFKDNVWSDILKRVVQNEKKRENSNFSTVFCSISKYLHLESYLILGISLDSYYIPMNRPVSQFSKPVIRFMRECGLSFCYNWESAYEKNPKLMTDICAYVLEAYHDNLLIYKHLYEIFTHTNSMSRFDGLVTPLDVKSGSSYYVWEKEFGFGAEYKALFDYVVKCIAVEAMNPRDVIQEYYDYLKMARKIKQLKHIGKLRESGDTTTQINDIGFIDYRSIEKYPKGLTIRHRIVNRNYDVMRQHYDEQKFAKMVDHNFAWEKDEYCVVTPNKSDDIKNEGTELNHCVGSYIDSVLQGRTQIVFMRKSNTPDQSLVTLEIRSREIQQARGYANRLISDEEEKWLERYAKAKNLTFNEVRTNNDLPCPTVTVKNVVTMPEPELMVS